MRLNVWLLAAMLSLSSVALAQSTYGAFKGTITDASGGVIKDATVEASNASTGVKRSGKTNAEGFFRLANMDPGSYNIAAEAPGFARSQKRLVDLLAREEVPVDLQLQVAQGTTTTVEVVSAPEVSDQLTMSYSKSGDVINSLALN